MLTKADRLAFRILEQVWLPKPFLNDCEWACADALVTHKPLLSGMVMTPVDVSKLEHTQLTVDHETVAHYAETGNCHGQIILRRNGQDYVYDGRHRTLAAQKLGLATVDAYVIDLPDEMPLTVDQFARKIRTDPQELISYMSVDDRRRYGESY